MARIVRLPQPKASEPAVDADSERLRKEERDAALLAGLLPPGSEELATLRDDRPASSLFGRGR